MSQPNRQKMSELNCQIVTKTLKDIKTKKTDFDQEFRDGNFEKASILKKEIEQILSEPAELTKETIERNQKAYDFFFYDSVYRQSLKKAYENEEVLLPSLKELILARKKGYTETIIIPGQFPRTTFLNISKSVYNDYLDSASGIDFSAYHDEVYSESKEAKESLRPEQFYVIFVKPEPDVIDAHPETLNKSLLELQRILVESQRSTELNLQGMSLPEYIYLDSYQFLNNGSHLDGKNSKSYLLAELLPNERALYAHHIGGIRVIANFSAESIRGARFVVIPKPKEANESDES